MNKNNSFLHLLNEYITVYLPVSKGLSKNTIRSYKKTFELLLRFFKERKGISSDKITFLLLDFDNLSQFLQWIEEDRNCTSSTRNQRLAALSSFSIYAQNKDFEAASCFRSSVIKMPKKKSVNKKISFFSVEEIRILLSLPNDKTGVGLRDKVLLSFMYATGTRAQEVCDLKVKDIDFRSNPTSVTITGKGKKKRVISIPDKVSKMISKYIKYRNLHERYESHIFSSQVHEQMSISCIEEIYKKYIRLAKDSYAGLFLGSYSPHSMRHTTACHMLEMGIPLMVIKNFLGHSSIQSTEIYVEVSKKSIDNSIEKWNEKWFSNNSDIKQKFSDNNIPDFLK